MQKIVTTYWSSFSGLPDEPENYQRVTYELIPEGEETIMTVVQTNAATAEAATHSEENWRSVLGKMKALLEKK